MGKGSGGDRPGLSLAGIAGIEAVVHGNRFELSASEAVERLARPEYRAALARSPHELVLDMDDTLNTNQPLYDAARGALVDVYAGFDRRDRTREERAALHVEVNRRNLPQYGFTPTRWLVSAEETAVELAGRSLSEAERVRVEEAARLAFGPGELYPGVAEALDAAREAGIPLHLLTKGEEAKQREKIEYHRLARWFDSMTIVDKKDPARFHELAERHGLRAPVSIGDRYGSDVEPALGVGYRGIVVGQTPDWEGVASHSSEIQSASSLAAAVVLLAEEQIERSE